MATYYVGKGGSDANNGQSWANRKLTLNGAEDIPVAAGDTVYVGPGTYRETLTCDVSGTSGNPITYIGDVTGAHTDGVGGVVRITGSNDDKTITRSDGVQSYVSYRTFRGFRVDLATTGFSMGTGVGLVLEDCVAVECANGFLLWLGSNGGPATIRRCIALSCNFNGIAFEGGGAYDLNNSVVENCIVSPGTWASGIFNRHSNVTIRNTTIYGAGEGIYQGNDVTNGSVVVNNCIIQNNSVGITAVASGDVVENYNSFFNNDTDRTNVATGANSESAAAGLATPLLIDGQHVLQNWLLGMLGQWSTLQQKTGASPATEDVLGIARPSAAAKRSWGAVQYQGARRDGTTTRGSGGASVALPDAGRHQIFVPVTGAQITVSVYAYREANYAGTAPQMVIKQPGQSDRTTTDAAAAGQWNQLSDTFTPASTSNYIVVELVSNNTATSGSYVAYFDDLSVT